MTAGCVEAELSADQTQIFHLGEGPSE